MAPSSGSFVPGAVALALFASTGAHAAPPRQPSGAELLRAIERLAVVGNVLYVAAHPDDENTRLLAWLVNTERVRAGYLSLTRGEGGQNLVGAEQAPLLGLIRTNELLAARTIDGAEQWFGRQRDFGYSKTPEETLAIWDHDTALADVVWAIRRFHPDVIVTRFSPTARDTHGHHTASAMLALEAFRAAADPHAFPEQLAAVAPWQARRIVWNKGVFGPASPEELAGFVKMDVGGFDPLLGVSAGEVAARSRSMHKSQGFGASPQRGAALEYFRVLAGDAIKSSFLDGVERSWARVPGSDKLRAVLTRVRAEFDPEKPAASIPRLFEAADALDALPENPWKADKRNELSQVIAACAGLWVEATAAEPVAVPGGELKVTVSVLNRSDVPFTVENVTVDPDLGAIHKPLVRDQPFTLERTITLPRDIRLTNPYWLDAEPAAGHWTVDDLSLMGLPEAAPPLNASVGLRTAGHYLGLARRIEYAWNDPVAGERRRPVEILPPVTIDARAPVIMFPDADVRELRVLVRASRGAAAGTVKPAAPNGFTVEPATLPFKLDAAGAEAELIFHVRPPARVASETDSLSGALMLVATVDGDGEVSRGVTRIEYPHLPILTVTPPARVKLVRFAMKRPPVRIGYLPGAGDEVAAALRQVGYDVTVLNDETAKGPLDRFGAIVVGVRAFNVNPRLARLHQHLMDWVAAGGTLLVQYNTNNRLQKLAAEIGPWPFTISQERVTEENAAVERADHPIFHAPNQIADRDFADWVQERGLYFAAPFDARYQAPLSMHDAGEPVKKGALLYARVGKGAFIYTGLAFFRQLPAGVPGAYRLFSNLLSHGR